MLDEFVEHKKEILSVIENIETLSKEDAVIGDGWLAMIKERLVTNSFNLVILGQFKRGKTTFINSLIGREVLPSSVVPLTSIVTILKFGKEVRCVIFMEDGSEREIT